MLAKFLKAQRAEKFVPTNVAISQLGNGWSAGKDGSIEKQFQFGDFHHANHFMACFANYCQKVNMTPEWSNVYNRVSVRLHNRDLNGVSKKEVEAAEYLDLVGRCDLSKDAEEVLDFERVAQHLQTHLVLHNNLKEPTSLFLDDQHKRAQAEQFLRLQ